MRMVIRITLVSAFVLLMVTPRSTLAAARVESNVVYGMYSGLALLMDVHFPDNPNGYGIVFIPGSGWHAPLSLDADPLKQGVESPHRGAERLLAGGYTLFSINHRAAPRFRYPAALEDAQRAVRYVRHHAARFGIDPDHIGAVGGSSGGYLALMLGVLDGAAPGQSPIDQESSKVQAVVALFPPTDFTAIGGRAVGAVASFLGQRVPPSSSQLADAPDSTELTLLRDASPVFHVSSEDPPFLLIHGDQDATVPYSQSEIFLDELERHGVTGELIRMPGGGHGASVAEGPNPPDYRNSMVEWLSRHLGNLP